MLQERMFRGRRSFAKMGPKTPHVIFAAIKGAV